MSWAGRAGQPEGGGVSAEGVLITHDEPAALQLPGYSRCASGQVTLGTEAALAMHPHACGWSSHVALMQRSCMRDGRMQRDQADHCLHVGAAWPGKSRRDSSCCSIGRVGLAQPLSRRAAALGQPKRRHRGIVKATILSECAQPVWGV